MPIVIAFETTKVSPSKTAAEIEEMLRLHGVEKVGKNYDSEQRLVAIYFQTDTPEGSMPFRLPVNTDAVYQLFVTKKKSTPAYRHWRELPRDVQQKLHEQAERTAWRIIHGWLKGQLALLQTQMATITELFLAWMLVGEDETLHHRLVNQGYRSLTEGREDVAL